ncbi:MAG: outer membrane protein assembly factor BamA [Gemmatimonadaceae bacterium]
MSRLTLGLPAALTGVLLASVPLHAQDAAPPPPTPTPCARPDTVVVRGNERISEARVRSEAGLTTGEALNFRLVQRALENLYGSGQFEDASITCEVAPETGKARLVIAVVERPRLLNVTVSGADVVSEGTVRDKVNLPAGEPLDPARVARAVRTLDSLYESRGYFLARVRPETTVVDSGVVSLEFQIDEGRRLAVSGIQVEGNRQLGDEKVVDAMKTSPEGFWWFRKGEFDEEEFAGDLGERLPALYGREGFIDFQVTRDTLIVDPDRGKALIRIGVQEGPRYRVGDFEVVGNRRFPSDVISRFYPFNEEDPSITERVKGLFGGGRRERNLFNREAWDEATNSLRTAYSNEGYIYAQIEPVLERSVGADSVPRVNLRWEIEERTPAIVNRVDIVGNDYTTEACIRDALVMIPGDVFSQDRLIRSYHNIANLGFFEAPMEPPETRPANDEGDVDIVFRVKEKRTGNINFGASLGQGTGVGGFLGLDQPNLFGRCKRVSLQWQFGRYINDFQLSYTDPAIRLSRISGTATAYHTRSRFIVADLGRQTRTGGSLQFGFPLPRSPFSRLYLQYAGEAVRYQGGIADQDTTIDTSTNFRSSVGVTATRDTRIDLPFATAGGLQTATAQFNGGPLGGTSSFQRLTAEVRSYAPLGQFGGNRPGSQPVKFVFGVTARAGAVFGNTGPFFVSQKFALGGTQFGEIMRGYEEFSITPAGVVPGTSSATARRESFGNAFFTATVEVGLRLNQAVYLNLFHDAGNIWNEPREFNPTRLFRGAGVGVALVTPLGPLGLDWAYGFDRVDDFGRRDPKWQLHFRLGNIF